MEDGEGEGTKEWRARRLSTENDTSRERVPALKSLTVLRPNPHPRNDYLDLRKINRRTEAKPSSIPSSSLPLFSSLLHPRPSHFPHPSLHLQLRSRLRLPSMNRTAPSSRQPSRQAMVVERAETVESSDFGAGEELFEADDACEKKNRTKDGLAGDFWGRRREVERGEKGGRWTRRRTFNSDEGRFGFETVDFG